VLYVMCVLYFSCTLYFFDFVGVLRVFKENFRFVVFGKIIIFYAA